VTAPAGGWRRAVVRAVSHPTETGCVLRLEIADRVEHWPGQHYVVRLTAEDGYTASRSYSVASDPGDPFLELFVEKLADGEVSGYLADVVAVGDELEVRGPIGGWFVWRAESPAVCIGGGTGVVPLVSMLRHARRLDRLELIRLAVSGRTLAELPYAAELISAGAIVGLSREQYGDRGAARLSVTELTAVLTAGADYFVCGSAPFAESVSTALVGLGIEEHHIRVERFGPSG
jgi:ferredoxin-NADP reductase